MGLCCNLIYNRDCNCLLLFSYMADLLSRSKCFLCLYHTSRKTFFYCMIACLSGAMYTTYVQGQNNPSGRFLRSYKRGDYIIHLLLTEIASHFKLKIRIKNIVQLSYKNEISLGKETDATITCRSIMCIRG